MLIILMLSLVILLVIFYYLSNSDLLSPIVINVTMFLISSIFSVFVSLNWGLSISLLTIFTILVSIITFNVGVLLSKQLVTAQTEFKNIDNYSKRIVKVRSNILVFLIIIFMLIITFLYYRQVYDVALAYGYSPSSGYPLLKYYRMATLDLNFEMATNKLVGQGVIISFALGYLFLFMTINNIVARGFRKIDLVYVIPVMLYSVQAVLTGGRTQLMYLISAVFFIAVFCVQVKNNWRTHNNGRIIKRGIGIFIIFLGLFYFLGSLTGKTLKFNLWETLSVYVGTPIIALDKFLLGETPILQNNSFGDNTLFGIYDLLNRLSITSVETGKVAPFVSLGNYETNIYTSYMRYIEDFTFLGLILIQFFLGLLIGLFYYFLKSQNTISLMIVLYAIVLQIVLEASIEERFFMNILSVGYLLRFLYIILLGKIILNYEKWNEK